MILVLVLKYEVIILGTSSFNIHDIVMNQYGITSLWSFVYEDPNNKWDGPFPYVSNGNVYAKININIIVKKCKSIQGLNVTIDTPIKNYYYYQS